jgi:predicted  nucleic acid-binding Zn-ribbon protein
VLVDPFVQLRLLDLQKIDTALTQLEHRRRHLPEHAEVDKLEVELQTMSGERSSAQAEVDDLDRDIRKLETDIDQVRERARRNQTRLTVGKGPAKELEAIQRELASLVRRQGELEDTELDLMERREAAQNIVEKISGRLDKVTAARDIAVSRKETALATIGEEETKRRAERGPIVLNLPKDFLALYEKIRKSSGGIGAAPLRARRCEGCRLELSGGDLARVRSAAADEVVRCEECSRILIRTGESGL